MFDSLKKRLREGVQMLSKKEALEEQARAGESPAGGEERPEKPAEPGAARPGPAKDIHKEREKEAIKAPGPEAMPGPLDIEGPQETDRGRLARLKGIRERVSTREITDKDIDRFFDDSETELLRSDVALEVADAMRQKLKERLVPSKVSRAKSSEAVEKAFRESLLEIVDQGGIDLDTMIREAKKRERPLLMVFLGYNGSGKTTSLAKLASHLKAGGFRPVLVAGDTFRAASIEQLEVHGKRLGIKVIKHQYGSDSAAVIFDAMKYAEKNGLDVVLADTAGRVHTDMNLMDELKKVVRVNNPDLRVLVVDSLTGNDAVEQARRFHDAVGVDCVVMTKTDVNPRGGSILSVVHTIGKPILFLGTGQEYSSMKLFKPGDFVGELLG